MVAKALEKVGREVVKKAAGSASKEGKMGNGTLSGQPRNQPRQIEKMERKGRTG